MKQPRSTELARKEIAPNPLNPRKRRIPERDAELAESIREHGILQPIVVRPQPAGSKKTGYELVIGERRWRAAGEAGLETVPVVVRELDDTTCLKMMLVENGRREDLDPLEEAETYHALHEAHGMTLAEVAAQVGKSTTAVHQRIKLMETSPEVRKALAEGRISISVAELIGRAVDRSLQKEALERVAGNEFETAASYRDAKRIVESEFMLRLVGVPWKLEDAELLAKAGACTVCPNRTGNQRKLFEGPDPKDRCLDRTCFLAKTKAAHERRLAELAEAGAEVLEPEEAEKLLDRSGRLKASSGYVNLAEAAPVPTPGKRPRSLRDVLGKKHAPPVKIISDPESGTIIEIARRRDVEAGLEAKGIPPRKAREATEPSEDARRKKKARLQRAVYDHQIERLSYKLESAREPILLHEAVLRAVALEVFGSCWQDGVEATRRRRGLDLDALQTLIQKGKPATVFALLVEMLAQQHHPRPWNEGDSGFLRGVASAYSVDLKAAAAEVRSYLRALDRKRPKRASAPKRKARSSRTPKKETQ